MFEKVIGNNQIKDMLSKSLQNDTLSHSYLFIGREGIGKRLLAQEFAKQILGDFGDDGHPDFMCIEPDGNSIKIEQVRFIQKKIQEKPIISDRKVYVINDAEKMTVEAQNCLLKTLEEPPEFAIIILIGSNENSFLSTIKSRCMIIRFRPLDDEQIKKYMKENYNIDFSQNHLSMFQGSIGKAILLKDKQDEYDKIIEIVENLRRKDLIEVVKLSEILYGAKEEIFEILEYMNILLLKKAKEEYLYTNCIEIVENTKKRLKQNANYDMCIDNMVFNMWEEVN